MPLCFQKEPLTDQDAGRFRSFGPRDGFLFVIDVPAEAADSDGEVGVFGHGVCGDAASVFDGFFAPRAQSAGDDGDAVKQIEGTLLHILAGDVFESLPAGEPAGAVADFYVASYGAHFFV